MRFVSRQVIQTGPARGLIEGDLSFNGDTHPATLEVQFQGGRFVQVRGAHVLAFSGRTIIQRTQWGAVQPGRPPMKHAITAALLFCAACGAPPAPEARSEPAQQAIPIEAPSGEYALDKNHASLVLRANHFGLSHYTLRFTDLDATLNFNAEDPAQSTLVATARANSIETEFPGDGNFNGELQNSEWFDATAHPVIRFTSTNIERTGPNTGRITGDLEIRGQTHPATFDITYNRSYAQHPMGAPRALIGFSARGAVLRSQYGMNVLQPPAGTDIGVSDAVDVIVEAEFTRPLEDGPTPPGAETPDDPAQPAPANP
jgi:polyisoprenoid-binding protein YceI